MAVRKPRFRRGVELVVVRRIRLIDGVFLHPGELVPANIKHGTRLRWWRRGLVGLVDDGWSRQVLERHVGELKKSFAMHLGERAKLIKENKPLGAIEAVLTGIGKLGEIVTDALGGKARRSPHEASLLAPAAGPSVVEPPPAEPPMAPPVEPPAAAPVVEPPPPRPEETLVDLPEPREEPPAAPPAPPAVPPLTSAPPLVPPAPPPPKKKRPSAPGAPPADPAEGFGRGETR